MAAGKQRRVGESVSDQPVQASLKDGASTTGARRARRDSSNPSDVGESSGPKREHEAAGETARRTRSGVVPRTAADAPESVQRLLKSYELEDLLWEEKNARHVIVVAILTRGDSDAKRWLWSVLPRSEVRNLVREYRGAGCAEPDRALLRKQLRLTTADLPTRPYLGLGT